MAIQSDITVDFSKSPRLVNLPVPPAFRTIQDLHDTLRDIERKPRNGSEERLVGSVGKGGGGTTGVALTLNDAQLVFQTAAAELESGTVTTPDTAGVTLTDSTALFVTNGVSRGDVVENVTDGSHSTVLSVTSETELVTLALKGGTDNQYGSGDTYHVIDFVSCSVTGGDLFAVDSAGSPIAPILYTFGTGPLTIEQDTSPAAAPVQPATILEGTLTWEEAQRIILAATAGKLSGAATTNVKIRDTADSKDRIDATVDADGNRTAVTLDGS